MSKTKTITINDIRTWNPCYDPSKFLAEEWSGTALDILNKSEIPASDRIWVVCRRELLSDKLLRLFAVWCARQVTQPDERSINAINVAEAYAKGLADFAELSDAKDSAWSAAINSKSTATRDAARAAVWATTSAVEKAASRAADSTTAVDSAAEWAAAWATASDSASKAASAAASAAGWDAAIAAASVAAWDAASAAASAAQVVKIIEMIEEI